MVTNATDDWPAREEFDLEFFHILYQVRQKILQSEERQVGHVNVNLDMDIFVISEQKWPKFGLQAYFLKMFKHAKFSSLSPVLTEL